MKDTESSSATVPPRPKRLTAAPVRMVNVWLLAAHLIQKAADGEYDSLDSPYVLVMDDAGYVDAWPADHPEAGALISSPRFVCTLDASTPIDRLAASLHAATMRLGQESGA